MSGRSRTSNQYSSTGNNPFHAKLSELKDVLGAVLNNRGGDTHGISVEQPQLRTAKLFASKVNDPILSNPPTSPSQTSSELRDKDLSIDYFTEALLRGIPPVDGCGVGTPFITEGDGNCLLNAVAQLFVAKKPRGIRNDVKMMAAKLRLAIVLEGTRHMEAYISLYGDFFMNWSNYGDEVRDELPKSGWKIEPEVDNKMRVGSRQCARLMFIAQLRHTAQNRRWLQQFVFPILATVIQTPLRVFLPYRSLSDAYGATWDHTLFRPLYSSGPPRPAVHVVATIASSAEYRPNFENAAGWRAQHMGRLPELNHWVSLSSENAATAHESAVAASAQLKQTTWQTRDDAQAAVELAQGEQVPGQEKPLVEVKTAFKKASDMCKKREEYHALLTGTYFVPLASAQAAAQADKEAYKKCADEESDERRRKAKAAAASRPEATEEGRGVRGRWRKSPDGDDEPWSVSNVLQEAGLGKDWDGRGEGLDDNYEGPTFDDDCGGEGVHPAEREGRATERKACDRRRVYATMMALSKKNVGEIMKAVPSDQALHIQAEVDNYVRYLLADAAGDTKAKNPAPVKPPGRPKGQGASSQTTVSNPRAQKDNTRRKTRFKGSEEGGPKNKKIKRERENPT